MQTLGINEHSNHPTKGFWRRQFAAEATSRQRKFDWIYGVVLPVICVAADPVVFRGGFPGEEPLLWMFTPFAYLLSFVSIMSMLAWLLWGDRLKGLSAALAGLFLIGSIVSLSVGFLLLPLSLIGMVIAIGFLGFTPLFSGFVYLRNAYRAFYQAEKLLGPRTLMGSFILSAMLSAIVPWAVNVEVDRRRPLEKQRFRSWYHYENF